MKKTYAMVFLPILALSLAQGCLLTKPAPYRPSPCMFLWMQARIAEHQAVDAAMGITNSRTQRMEAVLDKQAAMDGIAK